MRVHGTHLVLKTCSQTLVHWRQVPQTAPGQGHLLLQKQAQMLHQMLQHWMHQTSWGLSDQTQEWH